MQSLFNVPRAALVTLSAASVLTLSACGSYDKIVERSRIDYKTTQQSKPLDIPPDLTSVTADDRFVVPDVGSRGVATASGVASGTFPSSTGVTGGGTPVLVQAVDARIERSGSQRWLVVNRPVEQVWPIVREFWLQSGFVLQVDRPEIGILETDWAENRAKIPMDGIRKVIGKVFDGLYSSEELDRYRTRLERTDAGTEVYISHRGLKEIYEDSAQVKTVWTPRPSDPEMEAEFLNRLQLKLAGETPQKVAEAKPAVAAAVDSRTRLVKAGDQGTRLEVRETFDRTWRRVGLALDRTGFTVEDRDRSKGLYYVQYRENTDKSRPAVAPKPNQEPGFFSRLLSFGSKPASATAPVQDVRVEGRYRVRVASTEGRTDVSVQNGDGQIVPAAASERILGMIEGELR